MYKMHLRLVYDADVGTMAHIAVEGAGVCAMMT